MIIQVTNLTVIVLRFGAAFVDAINPELRECARSLFGTDARIHPVEGGRSLSSECLPDFVT